ncbi:hypothetical protein [Oceanobacillus alkalisoli]|nr:hypothetical protein [Oceanobacillus alkalisoli]MCF3944797.1 hypothetical protein [Oceanobacillus alkalisoli]
MDAKHTYPDWTEVMELEPDEFPLSKKNRQLKIIRSLCLGKKRFKN